MIKSRIYNNFVEHFDGRTPLLISSTCFFCRSSDAHLLLVGCKSFVINHSQPCGRPRPCRSAPVPASVQATVQRWLELLPGASPTASGSSRHTPWRCHGNCSAWPTINHQWVNVNHQLTCNYQPSCSCECGIQETFFEEKNNSIFETHFPSQLTSSSPGCTRCYFCWDLSLWQQFQNQALSHELWQVPRSKPFELIQKVKERHICTSTQALGNLELTVSSQMHSFAPPNWTDSKGLLPNQCC